jgi:hypothetical protein
VATSVSSSCHAARGYNSAKQGSMWTRGRRRRRRRMCVCVCV